MEFNPQNKEDLEEVLFSFMMEMETKNDFEKLFKLFETRGGMWSAYVKEINDFFAKNYLKKIRNRAVNILEANDIKKLDDKYFQKWKENEFLKHLENDFVFSEMKQEDKTNYKLFEKAVDEFIMNKEKTNVRLFFYLYFINKTNEQWMDKLINTLYKDKGNTVLENMKHIAQQCKEQNIDLSFIDNKSISNLAKHNTNEENEYIFLIKILKALDFLSQHNKIDERQNQSHIFINDDILDYYYEKYKEDIIYLIEEKQLKNKLFNFLSSCLKDPTINKFHEEYKSTYIFYLNLYIDSHIKYMDEINESMFIEYLSENIEKIFNILIMQNQYKKISELLKIITHPQLINEVNLNKINNYLTVIYKNKLREHLKKCINLEELELLDAKYSIELILCNLMKQLDKYLKEKQLQNEKIIYESIITNIKLIKNGNITDVKLFFYLYFINRTNDQWTNKLINTLYKNKGKIVLENMKHIAQQCKEQNIELSFIDNQQISNLVKNNTNEENEYIFLIKILKTLDFISQNNEIKKIEEKQDYVFIYNETNDSYYEKYIKSIICLIDEKHIRNNFCIFLSFLLKNFGTNSYQEKYKSTLNFYLKLYIDSCVQSEDETSQYQFIDFISENKEKLFDILVNDGNSNMICNLLKTIFKYQSQNQNNLNNINIYLNAIYENKLRQHLDGCLKKEELELFDEKYSIKFIVKKLKEQLDIYLNKQVTSNLCESIIKYIRMVRNENITDVKLLFYLFFINRTNAQWIDKLINIVYKDKGNTVLENMKYIAQQCKKQNIDLSFSDNKSFLTTQSEDDVYFIFYIDILKMMNKDNLNESINSLNQINIPIDNNKAINDCIKLIITYFESFQTKDIQIYTNISNFLLHTIKTFKDKSTSLDVLFWIIEREDINGYALYDLYQDVLLNNINFIVSKFKNKNSIIANLLLQITYRQPNYINDIFNYIKDILKVETKKNNNNYHLQYSIFYMWLCTEWQLFENVRKITIKKNIGNSNVQNLDVHCIFFYLHNKLRHILLSHKDNTNSIANIIKAIESKETSIINPSTISDNINKVDKYIKDNVDISICKCKKNKDKNKIVKDDIQAHLSNYAQKHSFKNIIYLDWPTSFDNKIITDIISFDIKDYYYELRGIFATDVSENKYVLLFNKFNRDWYDINKSKWINKLILPEQINKLHLIYFGFNVKDNEEFNHSNQLNEKPTNLLYDVKNKENDLYWKSFNQINESFPQVLAIKQAFFKTAFGWEHIIDQTDLLNKFEEYINNKNFDKEELSKNLELFLSLLQNRDNQISLNSKFGFYLVYMNVYQNQLTTSNYDKFEETLIDKISSLKVKLNLNPLKIKSKTTTEQIKNKIKECETEKETIYLLLIKIMIFLNEYFSRQNRQRKKIKEAIKDLCKEEKNLKPFASEIYDKYFKELVKTMKEYKNVHTDDFASFVTEFLKNTSTNNLTQIKGGYYFLKEYIERCFKGKKFEECFDTLGENYGTVLQVLYNQNEDNLLADLLISSILYNHSDIIYSQFKQFLRRIYFNSERTLKPILKYSIIMFFHYTRNKTVPDKINKMTNLVYDKDDTSTLLDIDLMFLYLNLDIKTKISKIKEQYIKDAKEKNTSLEEEERYIINMYEVFKNSKEGQKIKSKKKDYFTHMKEKIGNDIYGKNYINKAFHLENAIQVIKYEELNTFKLEELPCLIYVEYSDTLVKDENYFKPILLDNYYYEFKGLVSFSQSLKDLVYYDKYSEHWYSFMTKSWQDKFNFENNKKNYYIYLRKNYKHKGQELYINNLKNLDDEINFNEKYVDYSKTFMWFYKNNNKLLLKYSECFKKIFKNNRAILDKIKEKTNQNKSKRKKEISIVSNPCKLNS